MYALLPARMGGGCPPIYVAALAYGFALPAPQAAMPGAIRSRVGSPQPAAFVSCNHGCNCNP